MPMSCNNMAHNLAKWVAQIGRIGLLRSSLQSNLPSKTTLSLGFMLP